MSTQDSAPAWSPSAAREAARADLAPMERDIDLGSPAGAWLAPSHAALAPLLSTRRRADLVCRNGGGEGWRHRAWETFAAVYRDDLMRGRLNTIEHGLALLARPRVVIACAHAEVTYRLGVRREDPERAPRRVVARVLTELGAEDCGEVGA